MKKRRETISILLAAALLLALIWAAGWALLPKLYASGTDWSAYRKEPKNSIDVFFVGSSMVFCDVSPKVVQEASGIRSYVIGGPEQTIPVSYFYIKEACRTQSPKAIFLELGGMFFTRYEGHTPENIAFMPRGLNRLGAVLRAANREDRAGLLLPIIQYHSRWSAVTFSELRDKLITQPDPNAGYEPIDETKVQREVTFRKLGDSYYDYSLEYLNKISEFCAEKGIELYLYFAPAIERTPVELRERLEKDIADLPIAGYIDFNTEENFSALGLDSATDWVDGLHLNVSGAEKFSMNFAQRLGTLVFARK